jgi:hypothetical protein
MDDLFYEKEEHQILFWLLSNKEFTTILVYLITRREHQNLQIINYSHSIEIWNDQFTIVILLSVGIQNREYLDIRNNRNLHFITFSGFYTNETIFKDVYIKIIDLKEWFDEIMKRSKNEEIKRLYELSKLKISMVQE